MSNYPLPRAADGSLALPCGFKKKISEDFMFATALPSWLTTAYTGGTGSVTVSTMAANRGELVLTTPAANGATTVVKTTTAVDLSKVAWAHWEAEGFYVDSNAGITLFLGLNDSTYGAFIRADPEPFLRCNAYTSPAQAHDWWLTNNEWQRRKNRGILILPNEKRVALTEGDQIIEDWDVTSPLGLGPVFPSMTIRADAAAAKSLKIGRLSLTVGCY